MKLIKNIPLRLVRGVKLGEFEKVFGIQVTCIRSMPNIFWDYNLAPIIPHVNFNNISHL